jgi:sRNA-binding regulator protein Hfq
LISSGVRCIIRDKQGPELEEPGIREREIPMNRRPYRPNRSDITEFKDRSKAAEALKPTLPPAAPPQQGHPPQKKMHPPTDTYAENYYYLKQMGKKTPMAVVFNDGQVIEGYIEWYDRNCIKLNRENEPNLLIFKNGIKLMYKLNEGKEGADSETDAKK